MNVSQGWVARYVFPIAFVLVPVLVAITVALLTDGGGEIAQVQPYLLVLAVLALVPGLLFLRRAGRLQKQRAGQPPRPSAAYEVLKLGALGIGCFAVAEACVMAAIDWRVGAGYVALMLAWVLVWTPPANRTILMRSQIEVVCAPQAAFALVSNPNNWPLYAPEIELVEPVAVPVGIGAVIHDRVRRDGNVTIEADEEVVALEAGVRFGTAIRQESQPSSGIYEFAPVPGGTRIEYTHRTVLSVPAAIFGIGLRRPGLMKKMLARRAQSFARIKRLLEEGGAPSV
jgi:hypothetical protein